MEYHQAPGIAEAIALRLDEGEDVQESVERLAQTLDIQAGAVISGIGTLKRARLHMVQTTGYPTKQAFLDLVGPIEVASIHGIIADREPHLHVTIADQAGRASAGHLEPGCVTLYLCELVIVRFADLSLRRVANPETGINQLTAHD